MSREKPNRAGDQWSLDEEMKLISFVREGCENGEIASSLERAVGGIQSRRKKIAEILSPEKRQQDLTEVDEEKLTSKQKGDLGELRFSKWLDGQKAGYVFIKQSGSNSFALSFSNALKRPDFFVLIERLGLIAVDVKFLKSDEGYFRVDLEKDLVLSAEFESHFRMCFWFAFLGDGKKNTQGSWYFINAMEVVEKGTEELGDDGKVKFIKIPFSECVEIPSDAQKIGPYLAGANSSFGVITNVLRKYFNRCGE
ncbi:hypothetical protein [Halocynthiibacter sp.]|uniref:hypothetical protein n=1 Tax=Halocynthiibacter sp. TaxID=1979210 RepID=UPI003C5F8483